MKMYELFEICMKMYELFEICMKMYEPGVLHV